MHVGCTCICMASGPAVPTKPWEETAATRHGTAALLSIFLRLISLGARRRHLFAHKPQASIPQQALLPREGGALVGYLGRYAAPLTRIVLGNQK